MHLVWGLKVASIIVTILIIYPALCRITIQIYFEERKKNEQKG